MNINQNNNFNEINSMVECCKLIKNEIYNKSYYFLGNSNKWNTGIFNDLEQKIDQLRTHINNLAHNDINFQGKLVEKNVFSSLEVIMPILNQYQGGISATSNSSKIDNVLNQTAYYSITNLITKQVDEIKQEAESKLKNIDPSYEIEQSGFCIIL